MDFSSNHKFMCMAERRDCKDWIAIYYAGHDWKMVNCFEAVENFDVQDCKWIMQNTAILVQDSPLEPKFVIYSALTGSITAIHQPNCNGGLGIRTLTVSPNTKLLACGTFDTNLVLYNNMTQVQICELEHPTQIDMKPKSDAIQQPIVFREELARSEGKA